MAATSRVEYSVSVTLTSLMPIFWHHSFCAIDWALSASSVIEISTFHPLTWTRLPNSALKAGQMSALSPISTILNFGDTRDM